MNKLRPVLKVNSGAKETTYEYVYIEEDNNGKIPASLRANHFDYKGSSEELKEFQHHEIEYSKKKGIYHIIEKAVESKTVAELKVIIKQRVNEDANLDIHKFNHVANCQSFLNLGDSFTPVSTKIATYIREGFRGLQATETKINNATTHDQLRSMAYSPSHAVSSTDILSEYQTIIDEQVLSDD